ncbi:MAG: TATA-box-binding protein [Candidatus Woesearchaeota archaeon]
MKMNREEIKKGIKIVNIVVTTSLQKNIQLERVAANLPNTEYNPEQFPGLVLKLKNPKTSALIFNSGNVVCTGATSLEDVEKSIQGIIENLAKVNIIIDVKPQIQIQNIVASGTLNVHFNLNVLSIKLENTEYEPEQFPGLVYKLPGAKATFLIFSNGKIVCTGTNSEKGVHEAIDKLIDRLEKLDI